MRPLAVFITASWILLAFVRGAVLRMSLDGPRRRIPIFSILIWKRYKMLRRNARYIQYGSGQELIRPAGDLQARDARGCERIQAYKWGNRPGRIETADPTFFSLRTGEPIVWYHRKESGIVELFDLMGFDPDTGDELLPVTREVVALWRTQKRRERKRNVGGSRKRLAKLRN